MIFLTAIRKIKSTFESFNLIDVLSIFVLLKFKKTMIKKILLIVLIFAIIPLNAQRKKDKILLTIDNEPVYVSEFLRVYNKNKDIVSAENKKSVEEYLDLFINYKLKLKEAKDLKLDTVPSYLREFNKYKEQLIEPFLKDREVTDKLIREAYDRMKKEVKASHILVMLKPNQLPKDTLKAYNKIMKARNEILNGGDFAKIAKKYSEDPSAKTNGGNLGYFTAFSMVYPFETAAYTTDIGKTSMPFKTRFGYHIVKVEDVRDSEGDIQVAHIMIRDKKIEPDFAKKQIDEIYQKYKQGDDFEFLAKKYSDDKASSVKGGVIRKFSHGSMIQPFADISFKLQNIGEVSTPFKTKFGWHIVKLIKRFPIQNFEDLKDELQKKIEKGERSVLIGKSIVKRLKKKYDVTLDKDALQIALEKNKEEGNDQVVLKIEEKTYSVNDLKQYLSKPNKTYKDFIDAKIIAYYKDHLEYENPEFAATLKEYRDGLLLFDLLQKKIWTKAEKDTIGLQKFFNANASNYTWKKRVKAEIASCTKKEKAALVEKYMIEGKSMKEIKELVNEGAVIHVLFHSDSYEIDSKKLPTNFIVQKGVKRYEEEDEHYSIINVTEILASSPKELKDIKGKVISNYQDYLEKKWITDLRNSYKVKLKKRVFKKIAKKNN